MSQIDKIEIKTVTTNSKNEKINIAYTKNDQLSKALSGENNQYMEVFIPINAQPILKTDLFVTDFVIGKKLVPMCLASKKIKNKTINNCNKTERSFRDFEFTTKTISLLSQKLKMDNNPLNTYLLNKKVEKIATDSGLPLPVYEEALKKLNFNEKINELRRDADKLGIKLEDEGQAGGKKKQKGGNNGNIFLLLLICFNSSSGGTFCFILAHVLLLLLCSLNVHGACISLGALLALDLLILFLLFLSPKQLSGGGLINWAKGKLGMQPKNNSVQSQQLTSPATAIVTQEPQKRSFMNRAKGLFSRESAYANTSGQGEPKTSLMNKAKGFFSKKQKNNVAPKQRKFVFKYITDAVFSFNNFKFFEIGVIEPNTQAVNEFNINFAKLEEAKKKLYKNKSFVKRIAGFAEDKLKKFFDTTKPSPYKVTAIGDEYRYFMGVNFNPSIKTKVNPRTYVSIPFIVRIKEEIYTTIQNLNNQYVIRIGAVLTEEPKENLQNVEKIAEAIQNTDPGDDQKIANFLSSESGVLVTPPASENLGLASTSNLKDLQDQQAQKERFIGLVQGLVNNPQQGANNKETAKILLNEIKILAESLAQTEYKQNILNKISVIEKAVNNKNVKEQENKTAELLSFIFNRSSPQPASLENVNVGLSNNQNRVKNQVNFSLAVNRLKEETLKNLEKNNNATKKNKAKKFLIDIKDLVKKLPTSRYTKTILDYIQQIDDQAANYNKQQNLTLVLLDYIKNNPTNFENISSQKVNTQKLPISPRQGVKEKLN